MKRKKHKKYCKGHKRNVAIGLIALLSFCFLSLFSTSPELFFGKGIVGAAILKNKCTATPESYVFVGSNDNWVYAFDENTGCIVWKYDAGGDIKASPLILDDTVYVATTQNKIHAITIVDGTKQWGAEVSGKVFGSLVTDGNHIFAADNSGTLTAFLLDGSQDWTDSDSFHNIKENLQLENNILYLVDEYLKVGTVIAFDLEHFKEIWRFSAKSSIMAEPLITTDAIYVPSNEGVLYKLNKEHGVAVWMFKAEKSIRTTPVMDEDGILYFGSNDGNVYAVNSLDGSFVWKYFISHEIEASASLDERAVYVGAMDNKIYALDKVTGALLWSFTTQGKMYGNTVVLNGKGYVTSADYTVYAFDATTGTMLWNYKTGGAVYSGVTIKEKEVVTEEIELLS